MSEPPSARLLSEQRQRWGRGDSVPVEELLRHYPSLRDEPEAVLDLIYQEVVLREGRGESPDREEYLLRFPQLAAAIADQFEVHQAIEAEAGLPEIPGYVVLAEVGRGGMGRVFRARDAARDRLVAVKVLRPEHCAARAVRKRFVAEARAAAALDHPNIIKVYAAGLAGGEPYFVMELIEGYSLEEVVRHGPADPLGAAAWLAPVAEAIHYAHSRGVIHRDLKPANVMIDATGRPRVMDFGMAKVLRGGGGAGVSSTQQGTILGTPSYMPPEQAGGGAAAGPCSDVYSLGAVLYALLTGRPPFDEGDFLGTVLRVRSAESPPGVRRLRPAVPESLERICHRCLSKRPGDRFSTAGELSEVLRAFVATATHPTPTWNGLLPEELHGGT
jgi:serine/threonine protein kinase